MVRDALPADASSITDIHNSQGVARTASYRSQPGTLAERLSWLAGQLDAGLPVLVASVDDSVVGFASYGPFRPEEGYDRTVEHSVYVAPGWEHRGVGRMLMTELIARARRQGFHAMVGVVDAANAASRSFHQELGFVEQGVFTELGHKFGRGLDVAYLVKKLDGRAAPGDDRMPVSRLATPGSAAPGNPEVGDLPGEEREVLSWELFGRAQRELAAQIAASGFRPDIIIAVARGGLIPAGALSYALDVKLSDAMNVGFYTGVGLTLPDPVLLAPLLDTSSMSGKRLLVVDDVVDSGRTMQLVMKQLRGFGVDVRSAVLYAKPTTVVLPDYLWRRTDRWIVFPWSADPPLCRKSGNDELSSSRPV